MKFAIKDPKSGRIVREANEQEIKVYKANNPPAPFDKPICANNKIIDTYNGPGLWHGGAGF